MKNVLLAENLKKHIETLCGYGVRLAGSAEEWKAAEYARAVCSSYGADCRLEDFPVMQRCVEEEHLSFLCDGKWVDIPCSLFSSSVSTGGKTVEADIVWFDSHTDYQREDLSFLKGKAVVHLGSHIETADFYRILMDAAPAFLMFVDTRLTSTMPIADGLFPAYVKQFGSRPTVNLAYFDAWKIKNENIRRARLCVRGEAKKSKSVNMVAELPGTKPELGCVYVGGHLDTQAGTVGADDNATGTAAVIELTRLLSAEKHLRTIRLIAFGAEEQLSVGSASYVRAHRREIEEHGVFMANFDTYGSSLGWNMMQYVGTEKLAELLKDRYLREDAYLVMKSEITPYVDNFPFNACGIPSFWIYRNNFESGNYNHHRPDQTPDKLDYQICAQLVQAGGRVIQFFADTPDISAYGKFSEKQTADIERLWGGVYGGW